MYDKLCKLQKTIKNYQLISSSNYDHFISCIDRLQLMNADCIKEMLEESNKFESAQSSKVISKQIKLETQANLYTSSSALQYIKQIVNNIRDSKEIFEIISRSWYHIYNILVNDAIKDWSRSDQKAFAKYLVQFILLPPEGFKIDNNFLSKISFIIEWDIKNLK